MKKILTNCLLSLAVLAIVFPSLPVKAEDTPVADQIVMPSYYVQGGWKSYNSNMAGLYSICQTFYPTKNRLTTFDLAVNNPNPEGGAIEASIRSNGMLHRPAGVLKIYHQVSYSNYESAREMSRMTPRDGQTLTLSTNVGYWICVNWMPDNTNIYYDDPTDYSGTLMTGVDGTPVFHSTQAFGFRTYGYNYSDPNPPPAGSTSTPGASNNSNSPSANTSTSIAVPTGVTATYSTADQGISVTWKASTTTTVTGYKIYRTQTSGKSYTKVGTVAKNILQYVDATVEKNATYYYIVRSYKDSTESVNSNEAKVAVPADAVIVAQATKPPVTSGSPIETYNKKFETSIWFWSGLGLAVILLGVLVFLVIRRRKKEKPKIAKAI